MSELDWKDHAACRDTHPDLFFPAQHAPGSLVAARKVCFSCPVRLECLNYALKHNIKPGIWGGRSERERRGMRTGKKAVA